MSGLSSHVLDLGLGCPARGLSLRLELLHEDGGAALLAARTTDDDGRVRDLLAPGALAARTYRLVFETGRYFEASGRPAFFPHVEVVFRVLSADVHHHVPLLLSPFGYSTYRGS